MKKRSILLSALSGAMFLSLCACGSKGPDPTPDPAPTESTNVIVASPDAEPTESANVVVSPDAEPTESMNVIAPEESEAVVEPLASQAPAATETPVQTQPIITPAPTPEPTPTPEAPAAAVTAAGLYDKVFAAAGSAATMDASFALEDFYNLSESDLEDFVLYMPEMSTNIEEIFIAKVKSGKMDNVKAACEGRQQGMAEEAAFYVTTGAYVDNYKLVSNGDWLLFCVCGDPEGAVAAFHDALK